jgi:4-hydroxy-3-polyprenylbenzoate decarboxylase
MGLDATIKWEAELAISKEEAVSSTNELSKSSAIEHAAVIKKNCPNIVECYFPPEAGLGKMAIVTLNKTDAGQGAETIRGIWAYLNQFVKTTFIIICDSDVDPHDWNDVIWAITTRMDPSRDTIMLDDSLLSEVSLIGSGSKMGLDATNKLKGECSREWGRPIKKDPAVVAKIDQIWDKLDIL